MPLVSTYKLATKPGKARWLRPVVDTAARTVRWTVTDREPAEAAPKQGRGARFRCLAVRHRPAHRPRGGVDHGPQPPRLARLRRQLVGAHERHRRPAGGVRAGHRPCPQPGDDRRARAVGQRRLRVERADPSPRLLAHPSAVTADVLGQAARARPSARAEVLRVRVHGRAAGEAPAAARPAPGRSAPPPGSGRSRGPRGRAAVPRAGIEPPPEKGSSTGGGAPPVEARISSRAAASTAGSAVASHGTSASISRNRRWRSTSWSASLGKRSGCEDGSSTSEAKSTARHAASGRRAHQRCSVDGWPWRIDFSRADSRLIASSGSATSMSLRFTPGPPRRARRPRRSLARRQPPARPPATRRRPPRGSEAVPPTH